MSEPSDRSEPGEPTAPSRTPSTLDFAALVLVGSAVALLLAGVIYAFAYAGARNVDSTERFRLLAQAASPFVATLLLAAVALVVHQRRTSVPPAGPTQVGHSIALGVAAGAALFTVLLALNGIVIDLSRGNVAMGFRLSNVLGRLVTVALASYVLAIAATAPVRRGSPRPAAPTPSPPGAPDSASPT